MKRLLFFLLWASCAFAQSTVVSSTGVVDAQGTTWVGGKYDITFVPDPKIPPANYTWSGGNLQNNLEFQGSLVGSSATFSVSIPSNSAILPVGSKWLVKVCPNAASSCYGMTYSVQGTTMDITATLNTALPPMQIVAGSIPWAYNSLEMVVPPNPGAVFWNVTTSLLNCWNGNAWTVTCANGGGGGGGTIGGSTTANLGVGTTGANNTLAPVPEINYTTAAQTAFACEEDHNRGDWDVRCIRGGVSWSSNPSQALVNTIHDGMCYHQQGGFTVHIPMGTYSIGGNILLPPQVDIEGPPGTEFGNKVGLVNNDPTKWMFEQVGAMSFTCSGAPNVTINTGTATMGNVTLVGRGSGANTDQGLINNTGGGTNAFIHNIGFQGFGGAGRGCCSVAGNGIAGNGQNSRGTEIFAASNLQWYFYSGAYNVGGFADTSWKCSLGLGDIDGHYDHLLFYGQLQDGGYYNRYYLCGVALNASDLTDSFLQIMPHLIYVGQGGTRSIIAHNRLDDAWWDAIHLEGGSVISTNTFNQFCTSPTLNPSNFPTNPGGVSTDPNCSAFGYTEGGLGNVVTDNVFTDGGLWPAWPVYTIYFPNNVINQVPTSVKQPPSTLGFHVLGGYIGYNNVVNPGADVSQSMYDMTQAEFDTTDSTMHFHYNKHLQLIDDTLTTYSAVDGLYPDTYVSVNIGGNSRLLNAGPIHTCTGTTIQGGGFGWWWYVAGIGLIQMSGSQCPSSGGGGGGGGTIGGSGTTGTYAIFTAASTIGNGHITESGGQVIVSLPFVVNDGSSTGGTMSLLEGTPAFGAANYDVFYGNAASHWPYFNPNNTSFYHVGGVTAAGTPGNCAVFGPTGFDFADSGSGCGTLPTYLTATTAGVPAASTMQVSLNAGVGRIQAYAANNAAAANLTFAGSSADGSTFVSFYWQMHNGTDVTTNLPLIVNASMQPNAAATTLSCSTSGTAIFVQPFSGSANRVARVSEVACVGTATWTYTHAFTTLPYAIGPKSADATTIGLNSVTITGSGTGQLALESIN